MNKLISGTAALYARVSSKEQEREGFSIDSQLKLLRQYASENGFEIGREFIEIETAKRSGRTKFKEMLAYLRDPKNNCETILVEKTDRLYRNISDWVTIDELDVVIHVVKEGDVISKGAHSSKKLMHGLKVLLAKQYIDNLSEEVRKGQLEKAEQGQYPGGKVPFGYYLDKNTKKVVVDEDRAPLVRQLFTLYAENKVSLSLLAKWARENSVFNRNGKRPITKSQIERILKHRFYLGEFLWNDKVYKGDHSAIISRELFEAVQKAFKIHDKPRYDAREFAFGDLMTCGTCGCKITAQIKKERYTYYHCTGMRGADHKLYIPEPRIAELFEEKLHPLVLSKEKLKQVFDRLADRHTEDSHTHAREQARLSNRLTQLEKWIEQAYVDKLEEKITENQWQSLTKPWQLEAENLRRLLVPNRGDNEKRLLTANRILELCQRLPSLWDKQDFFEKRKLVDLIYSNCSLTGRSLSATYRKPFSIIAEGHKTQNMLAQEDSTRGGAKLESLKPEGYLVDFEGEAPYPDFGWIGVSDTIMEGGKSQVEITVDSMGADGTEHSLKITGSVVQGENPFVMFAGTATRFWDEELIMFDLTDFTGVRFWAMGDGNTYRIELPTASISDYMYYSFAFTPPTGEWREYRVPFKGFKQMPFGAKIPWTATDVEGVHFMTVGGPIEQFTLHVDQIEFFSAE